MKRAGAILLATALFLAGTGNAGLRVRSHLVGHWVLEVDKLAMPPEARPKSVDLVFGVTSDGKWTSHVSILDQAGHELHADATLPLDGTPAPSTGTYWVDMCAATMPEPDVLVMQFAYQGQPTSTRVYTVNTNGKQMTETEAYFKKDGTPAMRIAYFSRSR